MSIASMTGFARIEGYADACSWTWEVKSVNGKGRDVRCRLAPGLEFIENRARDKALGMFQRGTIVLTLSLTWNPAAGGMRINREALGQVLALIPEIQKKLPEAAPPSVDGILAVRGVIEPAEAELSDAQRRDLEADLLAGLDEALRSLAAMRREEGARLAAVLDAQIDGIERLCDEAEKLAAMQPAAIRERLKTQVAALLEAVPGLPEERLAQEAALLMTKADVSEELDRIKAHVAAARQLMAENDAVGRKLDFLCQELNRETNTLCAKAADVELTRIGLELKAAIEQFREQVQNIE